MFIMYTQISLLESLHCNPIHEHNYDGIVFLFFIKRLQNSVDVVVYYRRSGEGCGAPKQRSATVWATSATSASPGADPTSSSFPPPCSKTARSQQGNK